MTDEPVLDLGTTREAPGRQAEAARARERAPTDRPASAKLHDHLAIMDLRTDRPELARAHLERAVTLAPGFEQARANLDRLRTNAVTPPR